MSLFQDENDFTISDDNMELDAKVKVEETFVNLDCIKNEEHDFEGISNLNPFEIKIKFEDVLEENSEANPGCASNLKGVLDDDVKIEEAIVKLENIKDEEKDSITTDVKHFNVISYTVEDHEVGQNDHCYSLSSSSPQEQTADRELDLPSASKCCNKCAGNYEGYCPNCSSLSHIFSNNVILDLNTELDLNTIPKNILEIRDVSKEKKVFALKALQKGVIFGPFDGVSPIECTTGFVWKINEWKFVTQGCGNWMKHVACAANRFCRNMDILQRNSDIYFQTSRKIKVGEELLIHYSDEVMLALDNREECYFTPERKRSSSKIFACSACYLGFRLESCLVEHKSKCPFADQGRSNEDFEIVKCSSCKMWLEKQEHLSRHMPQCLENYKRKRENWPTLNQSTAPTLDNENTNDSTDAIICNSTETQGKSSLNLNSFDHVDVPYECHICKNRFLHESHLAQHIINHESGGKFKCPECVYQTNDKYSLKTHLDTHNDIRPFKCGICEKKFHQNSGLRHHIKDQHSNKSVKRHKCPTCSYHSDNKHTLLRHIATHIRNVTIVKKYFDLKEV